MKTLENAKGAGDRRKLVKVRAGFSSGLDLNRPEIRRELMML
jgi:hypothetical protein